ncbi:hypothetical protein [Streptomyces sp. GC420]|nr:hypothetical protein [Streptomyces sp. GC420]NBM18048.1 hypothetical protein [Streptomyces sp. GC420]
MRLPSPASAPQPLDGVLGVAEAEEFRPTAARVGLGSRAGVNRACRNPA